MKIQITLDKATVILEDNKTIIDGPYDIKDIMFVHALRNFVENYGKPTPLATELESEPKAKTLIENHPMPLDKKIEILMRTEKKPIRVIDICRTMYGNKVNNTTRNKIADVLKTNKKFKKVKFGHYGLA